MARPAGLIDQGIFMLGFKYLSTVSSVFCFGTFAILMMYPRIIYLLFGIESSASADVMSRRAAILFLAVGTILWRSRDLPEGNARAGLAVGMFVFMAGFVVLGLVELLRGAVGPGILLPVAVELVFGILFVRHTRVYNKKNK